MKKIKAMLFFLLLAYEMHSIKVSAQKTINFPSVDGLTITADEYLVETSRPFILLCHQARYSRGEYMETVKKLNALGFNCLAADLRSGGEVNGIKNETAARARLSNRPTSYLDAEQDMIASIEYIFKTYGEKVILFGSSYSASLALKIAKENDKVIAVIAFSPGEYFGALLNLASAIKGLDKPVFAASAQSEAAGVSEILKSIPSVKLTQYIPKEESRHGSSALWEDNDDSENCWKALKEYLKKSGLQ